MPDNATPEQVRASIVPKSDQLNADDLLTGPITVTITGVRRGDKEQPVIIEIVGHQPYKPCKTMRRVLVATYSDDPAQWIGQQMTLYCDPEVKFGGVKVGGIRVSHLSGLTEPRSFMLTQTRGKRTEVLIKPIAARTAEDPWNSTRTYVNVELQKEYIAAATEELRTAETIEQLRGYGEALKAKSKPIQDALRPVYIARQKELQEA